MRTKLVCFAVMASLVGASAWAANPAGSGSRAPATGPVHASAAWAQMGTPPTWGQLGAVEDQVRLKKEQVALMEEEAKILKIEQAMQKSGDRSDSGPQLQPGSVTQVVAIDGVRGGGMVATLLLPSGGETSAKVGEVIPGVGRVLSMGVEGVRVIHHRHVELLSFVRESAAPSSPQIGSRSGYGAFDFAPPAPNERIPVSPPQRTMAPGPHGPLPGTTGR